MAASQAVRVIGGVSVGLLKYCAKNCPAGQPATTTVTLAVAVRPTPSLTRRRSVWLPGAAGVVSQAKGADVAPPNTAQTFAPSMLSSKVIGVVNAPLASMSTVVEPLTVW